MFTGIINGRGDIVAMERVPREGGLEARITIQARYDLSHIVIGESIAVNGACLTVERGSDRRFVAYASAETMRHTNLGQLRPGGRAVNLERALAVGDRLGGHLVSGHVDAVATVLDVRPAGESRRIRLGFPAKLAAEVVPKGSVTLDGISLTVNDCGPDFLEVNVIPQTWQETGVSDWTPGAAVNMETDILAKYVRRLLAFGRTESGGPASDSGRTGAGEAASPGLSLDFLRENGFC